MKTIVVALLTFATSAFSAQIALTPERPVSPPLSAPAAADQRVRGVASGNQIALAIWDDGRSGAGDLYATRIDANGVVLDPSGILIPNAAGAKGVVWNGSAFIIIASDLIFVAPDGTILKRKPKSVTQFVASSGSGAGVRMLFVSGNLGIIFDGSGEIITSPVELWPASPTVGFYAAAGSDGEFLVLYSVLGKAVFASRIDRNGKRLSSSVASGIDRYKVGQFPGVAGGANGWLVAGRATYQMTLYPLDGNGVLAGNPTTLENPQDIFDTVPPSIVSTNDGYLVAWTTNAPAMPYNANPPSAVTSVVRVSASGTPLVQAACGREKYSGGGYETAVTMIGSKWLILASEGRGNATGLDPIARLLTGTLDEIVPRFSVMSSATSQAAPRVASSKSNYAVLWTENGPDAAIHRFVRRFSLGAMPIDAAPIEVSSDVIDYSGSAQIVAAGDTYVVAWPVNGGYQGRRLSASTGAWIDAIPFAFDRAMNLALGSNGESAIAVYSKVGGGVWARVIAASGPPPLLADEHLLNIDLSPFAVASDGHGYLVAGTDRGCTGYCDYIESLRVLSVRLTAGGVPLDKDPLVLERGGYPATVSAAWDGSRWVVLWSQTATLLGAHISSDGVVSDKGTKVATWPVVGVISDPALIASGHDLTLVLPQLTYTTTKHSTTIFSIDSDSLAISSTQTIVADSLSEGSAGVANVPAGIVIAYDHIDTQADNVPRVFTRVFGGTARRRATR